MTKIVSNLEDNGSFSMKSIEMKFYDHSGMGSVKIVNRGLNFYLHFLFYFYFYFLFFSFSIFRTTQVRVISHAVTSVTN